MKILPQMYLWTKKNWFNFGSGLDPGSFQGFCNIFPQFGAYLWIKWSELCENFTANATLDEEVPIKFGKSSRSKVCIWSLGPDSPCLLFCVSVCQTVETKICVFSLLLLCRWNTASCYRLISKEWCKNVYYEMNFKRVTLWLISENTYS